MPGNKVVTVPEEVPLDVAVSCGVQGMTAHYLTHSAHAGLVKPGEWMLIHGTGSGTCQWAAQMAKLRGYKVIGTCSESKQDIARATGVDELIVYKEAPGTSYEDYSSVDLVPKVMEITGGEGVKAVIDGIGLATWETSIEVLGQARHLRLLRKRLRRGAPRSPRSGSSTSPASSRGPNSTTTP